MSHPVVNTHLNERARATLEKAGKYCASLLSRIAETCDEFLMARNLDSAGICIVIVGSVGRSEALDASDIDLIPVLQDTSALTTFQPHDKDLRHVVSNHLGVKVSKGEELTECVALEELTDPESIGGKKDRSSALTKRILVLTEGKQAGGGFVLDDVRRAVMRAYAGAERTRGRHILSLCNDLARYYRTLCIEYKAKADDPAQAWCTRNMKLRHSRKFWYFSCLMTVVRLADSNPQGDEPYFDGLLEAFKKSPVERLFDAVGDQYRGLVGRVTEPFAWFLEFMGDQGRRDKLAAIPHDERYTMSLDNPFHAVKLNSDRLHQELITLIDSLPAHQRHRILSWFLL